MLKWVEHEKSFVTSGSDNTVLVTVSSPQNHMLLLSIRIRRGDSNIYQYNDFMEITKIITLFQFNTIARIHHD